MFSGAISARPPLDRLRRGDTPDRRQARASGGVGAGLTKLAAGLSERPQGKICRSMVQFTPRHTKATVSHRESLGCLDHSLFLPAVEILTRIAQKIYENRLIVLAGEWGEMFDPARRL